MPFSSELASRYVVVQKRKIGNWRGGVLRTWVTQVARLASDDTKVLPFAEYHTKGTLIGGLAKRWFGVAGVAVRPSSRQHQAGTIKNLAEFSRDKTVSLFRRLITRFFQHQSLPRSIDEPI
jgi:hypothetical protein